MHPVVQGIFDNATNTITYIVSDPDSKKAAIVDPVLAYSPNDARIDPDSASGLLDELDRQGLELSYILETHAHADHLSAAHILRERTGAPVVIGANITQVQTVFASLFEMDDLALDGSSFDILVNEGDVLALGNLAINVLATPGHTPACITYIIGDAAFVGDTLFMPDYGTARADFPGGDAATLYRSVQKILSLPDETRIFVGHDYPPEGRNEPQWETSVADQRAHNVHLPDGIDEAGYVAMRNARDAALNVPRLILPSLQVNIRAGQLPAPSEKGTVFFRLPVKGI